MSFRLERKPVREFSVMRRIHLKVVHTLITRDFLLSILVVFTLGLEIDYCTKNVPDLSTRVEITHYCSQFISLWTPVGHIDLAGTIEICRYACGEESF